MVGAVLALSAATLVVQAAILRPHMWPAGAGLAVSGENVMGIIAEPRPVAVIRPPDARAAAGQPVTVTRLSPGGAADRAGIRIGDVIRALPPDPSAVLELWREASNCAPERRSLSVLRVAAARRARSCSNSPRSGRWTARPGPRGCGCTSARSRK